ncbi:hypothetical protein DSM112329_01169 [Paraconexibacter sp. AEG42_29]|uniref:SMP-30/Gluconolactonase/LRE-like region domain-containing protein n=1 Tax=Paraconexibacter sp. AEG42_29 TaxID=2997339 RepID=A0AAU7ARR9_9ACTN
MCATIGTAVAAGALAAPARSAADCPGTGADPTCPWTAATTVGSRADGTFRFPQAVAADAAGNVYVGDHYTGVIQVFTAEGTLLRQFGRNGTGDGELGQIGGIAVDPASGDVYVVDSETDRIMQFAAGGTFRRSVGGRGTTAGTFDFPSGPDAASPAGGGIAIANGAVYVADSGNDRIQRLSITAAAGGVDASTAVVLPIVGLLVPMGLAVTPAGVYVADDDNHRLILADEATGVVKAATAPGALDFPYGVAVDPAGNAYVANNNTTSANNRVAVFGPPAGDGTFGPPTVPTTGWGSFGTAVGRFSFPRDIAINPANGQILVADTANNRIQAFDGVGTPVAQWGASGRAPGQFTSPQRMSVSPFGDLLVADTYAYRAQVLGLDGTFGLATRTTMVTPGGVTDDHLLGAADAAYAPDGTIVVLDTRSPRIVRYDTDGRQVAAYPTPVRTTAASVRGGIAVDAAGNIWISDPIGDRLLQFDAGGSQIAATGSSGSAPGQFDDPEGVRIDPEGNVWVADAGNNRVQKLSATGQPLLSLTYPGTSPPDAAASIALDGQGHVFAASATRHRVVQMNATTGAQVARFGTRGTAAGEFLRPLGVAVQCDGTLVVADTDNNRLQRFTLAAAPANACRERPASPVPPDPTVPTTPTVPATPTTPAPPVTTTPTTPTTPTVPPASPKPAPRPAKIALRIGAATTKTLTRRTIRLTVGCNVRCALTVRGTLKASLGGPAVRLGGVPTTALTVQGGRARTVTFTVPRAAAATLARRLTRRGRKGLVLAVTVRATRTGAKASTRNQTFRLVA